MNSIWSPEILARASSLQLKARELVWGYHHGLHRNPRTTKSIEFVDHKPYSIGDPIRDIDWKVVARTDRLVVRRHQAESNLSFIAVVDASGDMATADGSRPPIESSKFGYAITLAASMLLLLQGRGEKVGLSLWGGEGATTDWMPPRSSKVHLTEILTNLAATKPANVAGIPERLVQLANRAPKRSVICIFSDFMEPPEEWGPSLRALASRGMDIRIAHLHSQKEFDLDLGVVAQLHGYEDAFQLAIEPDVVRPLFQEVVQDYLSQASGWASNSRAIWIPTPFEKPLQAAFVRLMRGV